MANEIYSTAQAAKILNVTARTVQLWADGGLLDVGKTPGGHRRIKGESVERLLNTMKGVHEDEGKESVDRSELDEVANPHINLLMVDDDPDFQKMLCINIKKWNLPINIHCASDGYQALIEMGHHQPDIILADIEMPNMDGIHMIQVIQGSSILKDASLMILTGLNKESLDNKWNAECNNECKISVIEKPINFSVLKKFIEKSINHQNSKRH